MADSSFQGDVGIELNGAVQVPGSSFGGESASFKLNAGPVVFTGNTDVSVSFEENTGLQIQGNMIVGASVTENTGGVSVVSNTFETLLCVDNRPSPTLSGNSVTILAEGQCRNFA